VVFRYLAVMVMLPFFTAQAFQVMPVPGSGGRRNILPAAVCFIRDGQVCRLSPDGSTVTVLTREENPVEAFDVSPVTGELVLVAGNSLILPENGGDRTVLAEGAALPVPVPDADPLNDPSTIRERVASPRWSPDGASIAFVRNGLMLVSPSDGAVTSLHPNGEIPSAGGGESLVVHGIDSWSPDGSRLLVVCYDYPVQSAYHLAMGLKEVSGGLTILAEGVGGSGWSPLDGSLYIGYPGTGGTGSLCRIQPPEWNCSLIGQEVPARSYFFYAFPFVASDGGVLVFIAGGADPMSSDGSFTLYRLNPDGTGASLLRLDSHTLSEALWAPDGSGALLVRSDGNLVWIPAGDGPAVLLPVDGAHSPRWMPPGM
jgi:hypothetical protein